MTRSARAAALRSTALATSLALAVRIVGLCGGSRRQAQGSIAEAAADRAQRRAQNRRRYRHAPAAARTPPRSTASAPAAPVAGAGDPPACSLPPPARKPSRRPRSPRRRRPRRPIPRRWKTSSSWCASASPPTRPRRRPRYPIRSRKKLAEWIILRSDDNGASVERYRAFIAANPSWPSQTFLRRRLEAALWDDRRDDAAVVGMVRKQIAAVGQGQILAGEAR